MKKIYFLKSCSTNQRILKQLNLSLDCLKEKVGSYEALFSKKAMKYKSLGLNEMKLTESDFKRYMLEEYTFLKRPFIINNDEVFIGNSKNVVNAAIESFNK